MVAASKRQHQASQIKAAVLPLLTNSAAAKPSIPTEVRSLPLFAQDGSSIDTWAVSDAQGNRGLAFVTGSGFGHWGVVVCLSQDAEKAAKTLHGTIMPWEDGVYFWIEK